MDALKYILIMLLLAVSGSQIKAQTVFTSFDDLLDYARAKSLTLKSGDIRAVQAKKAKLAAFLGVADPTGSASFSFTDNTKLPVSLFPAEAFGGSAGAYREVKTGVQYVNNFNNYSEIKLLNLAGWENLKLAKINIGLVSSDNKITLKSLFDNLAAAYYNIVNVREQIAAAGQNLEAAETLLKIAQDKYGQGLVKQQDVNDAKAAMLAARENVRQLGFLAAQNELSLKMLCDIPETEPIVIRPTAAALTPLTVTPPNIEFNGLSVANSLLKEQYAAASLRQIKKSLAPTLSFVFSDSYQQYNPNFKLFDSNAKWYRSNYIGLKLNINMPTANSISQKVKARFDYELAQNNTEQVRIKSELEHKQLMVNFDKALSQANADKEIYDLRKDTYEKNQGLYAEGLIGLDQTVNSYNAMVNAQFSFISSVAGVQLAQYKIDINNKIK